MTANGPGSEGSSLAARSLVVRITEALDLDMGAERWRCNRCGADLGPAMANYKEACLLYDRDPRDIHGRFPGDPEFSFSPHPDWCRIVEVYCPGCATMLDVEYLPPGHPPTHDIQLDLAKLRERMAKRIGEPIGAGDAP